MSERHGGSKLKTFWPCTRQLASALQEWRGVDEENAATLDEVLAEIGADDSFVENAARLADLIGRVGYEGGLNEDGVEEAESERETLVEGLDKLLTKFEDEGREENDA